MNEWEAKLFWLILCKWVNPFDIDINRYKWNINLKMLMNRYGLMFGNELLGKSYRIEDLENNWVIF